MFQTVRHAPLPHPLTLNVIHMIMMSAFSVVSDHKMLKKIITITHFASDVDSDSIAISQDIGDCQVTDSSIG